MFVCFGGVGFVLFVVVFRSFVVVVFLIVFVWGCLIWFGVLLLVIGCCCFFFVFFTLFVFVFGEFFGGE